MLDQCSVQYCIQCVEVIFTLATGLKYVQLKQDSKSGASLSVGFTNPGSSPALVLSAHPRAHYFHIEELCFESYIDLLKLFISEEENDVPWSKSQPVGKEPLVECHKPFRSPRL